MKPITVNKSIMLLAINNMLSTSFEIEHNCSVGVQLLVATTFQRDIARKYGAEALPILQQFLSEYLTTFQDTWLSEDSIRFCYQVTPDSQDGVQLTFIPNHAKLQRLTAIFDVTTFSTIKEWKF